MKSFKRPMAGWILRLSIVSFVVGAIVGAIGTQDFHAKATASALGGVVASTHAPESRGAFTLSRERGDDRAPRTRGLLLLLGYVAQRPFGRSK